MKVGPQFELAAWQKDFVDRFVADARQKSLLVAAAGTGKTVTALTVADVMLWRGLVEATLIVSDRLTLRDQWRSLADRYGIRLADSLENQIHEGASTTIQSLSDQRINAFLEQNSQLRRWFIIADEAAYESNRLTAFVDRMLVANKQSRALFISRTLPPATSASDVYMFGTEVVLGRPILEAPSTEIGVARFAPSFSLLRRLQAGVAAVDRMSWRGFEKLIAALLEGDGYVVELMRGTKDGGVDVVAVKDLGISGYFKAVWQAKKSSLKRRVELSVVRELADTRLEFGASKGIIVTSSYLTRGALHRIERDKYVLGKVDREDLDAWIQRTLFK